MHADAPMHRPQIAGRGCALRATALIRGVLASHNGIPAAAAASVRKLYHAGPGGTLIGGF